MTNEMGVNTETTLDIFLKKWIPIRENNMQRGTDLQKIGDGIKEKKIT